jgi:hypothetical protein
MPRPEPLDAKYKIVREVRLGTREWENIASYAGIKPDQSAYPEFHREVQSVLEVYFLRVAADRESPARIVVTLKPILNGATTLADQIRSLSPALRAEIHPVGQHPITDKELDLVPRAIRAAIERHKGQIRKNRRKNHPLRDAARGLQDIFCRYYVPPAKPSRAHSRMIVRDNFIYNALNLAGIRCPSPEDGSSRFRKLLLKEASFGQNSSIRHDGMGPGQ